VLPSRHNPDVPAELETIVMTALERDPARRWQNATALRNALAGAAKPSTNAEVMEWVNFVFALGEHARPVRGSRPLSLQPTPTPSDAFDDLQRTIERPKLDELQLRMERPSFDAIEIVDAQPMIPMPRQLPLPANPTPAPMRLREPMALRPARQLVPTIAPIGAAMIARRKQRRLVAPLMLILLGGIASALAVPAIYEALTR
jgi:hypothetical protein